jgi:hypothetical protein
VLVYVANGVHGVKGPGMGIVDIQRGNVGLLFGPFDG